MVIVYYKKPSNLNFGTNISIKELKKKGNKHTLFSNKSNTRRITPSNRQFLKSLGFKLK